MKICVLSSGSKGNSTYIETTNHKILIDIGTSCLYIEKCLKEINVDPNDIDIILVTHAHVDHINGIRVFQKKYKSKVYISKKTLLESKLVIESVSNLEELETIKDIKISNVHLSHDVEDINGYIIEESSSSMVYITDTGYIQEKYFDKLKNKNLYVFESNHDVEKLMNNPKYPHHTKIRILSDHGHLSNKDSSYYLSKIIGENTKHILLAHLSEENNDPTLALDTLKEYLKRKDINIPDVSVAYQNQMTEVYEV